MAHPTDDKNFRLPTGVRPRRYAATLTLDFQARTFEGQESIELSLGTSSRELVLHAVELELASVELTAAGRKLAPRATRYALPSGTVVLEFGEVLPEGSASLALSWRGRFNTGLRGLYLAGAVAGTQFEAADARRVFPCFDEPAFKACWALSVRVPRDHVALSNGEVEREETEGALKRVTFRETEPLSSYLVALVAGPLSSGAAERAGQTPVRTWAVPDKAHLTRFGQEIALRALPLLQDYFGLPYAFGKVDQVGLPEFEAGAMENAGLITYRETALLVDPATAPLSVKKRVAETVTHELAHQWFGNWVTMVWWDDLWLNEAFATWMAYKIVDVLEPGWRVWLDFDEGKAAALQLDALRSTHPIRGVVRNADEAGESFDLITYEKGGSVLRMLEAFLGEEPFREGIRTYMKRHARANAVADDLWRSLAEASAQPVLELANAWIRQNGHPLVSVTIRGRELVVEQRRFYSGQGDAGTELWPVPLVLRYSDGKDVFVERLLLKGASSRLQLKADPRWLCANGGATGFYRVRYDSRGLEALAGALGALTPAERISLLQDQWALVRSGQLEVTDFLDLVARFGGEEDHAVLDPLVGRLGFLESRVLGGGDGARAMRSFVEGLFGRAWAQAGWEPRPGEPDDARLRRAALLRAVGSVARTAGPLEEAGGRVQRVLRGDAGALEPNLLDPAFYMAARAGDAALFDTLEKRFAAEKDPAARRRYLLCLTAFEDPKLSERAQSFFFSGGVPLQDTAMFASGLFGNRVGRAAFWRSLRSRWAEVRSRIGDAPMLLRRVVEAMGQLQERSELDEARAFLAAQALEEVYQAVSQTLERLEQDVALKERTAVGVGAWLKARSG